jgi:hypothetical protein
MALVALLGLTSWLSAAQSSATTLSVAASDPDGGTLSYAWAMQSGPAGASAAFATANAATTTVTVDRVGDYIFRVVVLDGQGGSVASSTGTIHCTQAPLNTAAPTCSGTAQVGLTLSATAGTWSNPDAMATVTYAWSWQRADDAAGTNTVTIPGATGATYVLAVADLGKAVRAVQTATNAPYGVSRSAATAFTGIVASGGPVTPAPVVTTTTGLTTPTPTLAGTSGSMDVIRIYDAGVFIGSVVASGGAWTWTPTTPLAVGSHPLTCTAQASGEVESATSAPVTVVVPESGGGATTDDGGGSGGGGGCGMGSLISLLLAQIAVSAGLRRRRMDRMPGARPSGMGSR